MLSLFHFIILLTHNNILRIFLPTKTSSYQQHFFDHDHLALPAIMHSTESNFIASLVCGKWRRGTYERDSTGRASR
jgi:hypothetical protein